MIVPVRNIIVGAAITLKHEGNGLDYRLPVFEGVRILILNLNTFERVEFFQEYIWIPEDRLDQFNDMKKPSNLMIFRAVFDRPPFPENVAMGRDNGFFRYLFAEDVDMITSALTSMISPPDFEGNEDE